MEIGDEVLIRKDSSYYRENTYYNPADKVGTIIDIDYVEDTSTEYHYITVSWGGDNHNTYRLKDLEYKSKNPFINKKKFKIK